ncbi:hypothetical protein [Bradyrhizobium sp. CB2312]|uniref:hypothetical protein n=1 Tax=Bradyrhizobium sp. CB2312 TaxID=3039155 RepID=UPI0024B07A8F|nr:hypothetical protein [Bradyrhizobium sp. CB2312]WFU68600.1 hypothetical protein QA642_25060 [Bradyrhizobium sp. CB2312]
MSSATALLPNVVGALVYCETGIQVNASTCVNATPLILSSYTVMTDALLARAKLAMEESCKAREERLELRAKHGGVVNELHRNLLESASLRVEIAARRQDR